ncbi:hypothetical protein GQ43DRAFT_496741 [Delitschia confertaspora ATCC 74209]|uniref:Uncharacterized protein n=1 Tax=Delitschia confertaspora ATCC 74209 TaxID=1513339 RepID=A0A9P4JVJ0_9PLEO|nr:hypothetical protein GQ43DRAFT_496741 [Delitschia confertaspora ATCC 74209]
MTLSPAPQTPRNSAREKKDGTPGKAKATPDKQLKKPVDFGKAIGIDKPANIKDKIRKWQTELEAEGSATENKVLVTVDAESTVESSPKARATLRPKPLEEKQSPRPMDIPTKSVELPERPKSAKKPVQNRLDDEVRSASAPPKRVVSDSHWRTQQSSPTKDTSVRPEPKPLPTPKAWVRPKKKLDQSDTKVTVHKRTGPKPMVIYTSKENVNGQSPRTVTILRRQGQARPLSAGDEERPSSSGSGSAEGQRSGKDGMAPRSPRPSGKVEVVRIRRRRRSQTSPRSSLSGVDSTPDRRKSIDKLDDISKDAIVVEVWDKDSSVHPDTIPKREERSKRRSTQVRERARTSPEGSEPEPLSTARQRLRKRSHHPNREHDASLRPSSPPEALPQTPTRGLGVEAWLSATPDPFVDSEKQKRRHSKESVSSASDLSNNNQNTLEPQGFSESRSTLTVEQSEVSGSRRRYDTRNRRTSTDEEPRPGGKASPASPKDLRESQLEKEVEGTPSPTLTLKRRGARRTQYSPTKDRVKSLPSEDKTPQDEDAASSALASSVDMPTLDVDKTPTKTGSDNFAMRRIFPTTGKRLSTIASVETFMTKLEAAPPPPAAFGSEVGGPTEGSKASEAPTSESGSQFPTDTMTTLSRRSTRRKKANHADLISVLSLPRAGTKSIVSARSIRTNRSRLATATIGDIMNELASDEAKYMRELRTLVDGVIPVLLSCVLSKSDSAVAAGLFSRSASKTDPSTITKPIIDMGVSLERLKTLHKRVPKDDPDSFLSWARTTHRVYSDYIKTWRLGFQDVVVSLASADEDHSSSTPARTVDSPDVTAAWDQGLPQNAEGYVVNGNGEMVDVAYMLKRPLVRLKYLTKSLKGICNLKPTEEAEKLSLDYQELVEEARRRSNEERARLEDEAAAAIDPTRARDPRSLAPLTGVRIDPSRCVRARDYFDMHLIHSSGQEVSCRVEMLLRDDPAGDPRGGDLLLCEVDGTDRWLFFPPIQTARTSARNGDAKGEVIVMVRGYHSDASEWREVFSLKTNDDQAVIEWVQMLGTTPIPPQLADLKQALVLSRAQRQTSSHGSSSLLSAATGSTVPLKSRTPSPREIDIPIGEQANLTSKKWGYATPDRKHKSPETSPVTPPSSDLLDLKKEPAASDLTSSVGANLPGQEGLYNPRTRPTDSDVHSSVEQTSRNMNEAMMQAGSGSPVSLKRRRAKRLSRNSPQSSPQGRPSRQIVLDDPEPEEAKPPRKLSKRRQSERLHSPSLSRPSKPFSVWMPTSDVEQSESSEEEEEDSMIDLYRDKRPPTHRRVSSVPSLDLPTIPKLRKSSGPTTPVEEPSREEIELQATPASAPPKLEIQTSDTELHREDVQDEDNSSPPVPPHRSPSPATPMTLKGSNTPVLTPTLPGYKQHRRTSSPLKHQYEPSTATESSSESEDDYSSNSTTSESSEDELEDDISTPLMPLPLNHKYPKVSPPSSIYTLPNGTITPSQSASNTPYRAVPKTSGKASKSIASLFSWSDAGKWELVHSEECSIIVIPGKVEVYEVTAEYSKPLPADGEDIILSDARRPLVALELTPLVLLRKGTAIDISIRSRPSPESRIHTGSNFMLRSRNPTECSELYDKINYSRMHNPTYIALQNARGANAFGQPNWAQAMDRQNAARSTAGSTSSWWNLGGTLGRRSSYRKSSTRAASISAATESSVGTMNTAFRSALNRFSFGKNGRFNIKGSTLSSRDGSRSTGSFDSGSNGSGSGANTPIFSGASGAPLGITNMKVRLYERSSKSKWDDMGRGRLSIMLPDPATTLAKERQGQGGPGLRDPSQEKRILVVGKTHGETLLDVTLGESCFERIARTGIAVSVWEDVVGTNGELGGVAAVGGVSGARARVFMIQMTAERQCAYAFSLLGKQRY